jgi:hypothetical protein
VRTSGTRLIGNSTLDCDFTHTNSAFALLNTDLVAQLTKIQRLVA